MPAQMLLASRNKEKGSENRAYGTRWLSKTARPQKFKAGCQAGIRPYPTKLPVISSAVNIYFF